MCGIIGIAGHKSFESAFNGLRALEYRGYDSYGFGALMDDKLEIVKRIGAISEGERADFDKFSEASMVVGHTRWATHGSVSEKNSHPHSDDQNKVLIVHNGVIANFSSLKSENDHWELQTETDTEVAANFIEDEIVRNNGDLLPALQAACNGLDGEFAICGIATEFNDSFFAIKRKSPLIVAKYNGGLIMASDRTALAEFADSVELGYMDDDTVLLYSKGTIEIYAYRNGTWSLSEIEFHLEDLAASKNELGNYPHYMLKEINESPDAVREIQGSIHDKINDVTNEIIESDLSLTGSGSAYYVSMIGQYFFKSLANRYVPTHPSDEYLNIKPLSRRDIVLGISQSGETFDTLEVLRKAQEKKACTVALNNVDSSSMQRLVDFPIFQNAGKEVCVLSTKSIVSQTSALYLIACELGRRTGALSEKGYSGKIGDYEKLAAAIESTIKDYSDDIKRVAYQNSSIEHWFFIGRGAHYPVALESALKFKEVSYLHAEGMPAGFFKHGTISLIDENFYTVVFIPSKINDPELFQLTIDNVYEIRARGGKVIGFGHQIPQSLKDDLFFEYINLPDVNAELNMITQLVAGQLFAYYCAVSLNRNIDRPRALAKSVTVR